MAILAFGVNYKTAAIELRERVAFPEGDVERALSSIKDSVEGVAEAAILSTCNRTEIYCAIDHDRHAELRTWLASDRSIKATELDAATYSMWNLDAARHVMRVASGLDSQVLGEPQIMGQIKSAYDIARHVGTMGPELTLLSNLSLNVAKKVRSETDIGRNPVSVAYAAVTMAQQIFTDLGTTKALLIGAGETIDLVARHLKQSGVAKIGVANRTLENAAEVAQRVGGHSMQLTDIAEHLHDYDVVISSTGSPLHVLGKGAVENACRRRRHRPMFMVDIAVPRDIEPEVASLKDVYLYTIDDLTEIIEENVANRMNAAEQAESLIQEGAVNYARERRTRAAQNLVSQFRTRAEQTRDDELTRAIARLNAGGDPQEVIGRLARDITNKLLHSPTMAIRTASADNNQDFLEYLRSVFELDA